MGSTVSGRGSQPVHGRRGLGLICVWIDTVCVLCMCVSKRLDGQRHTHTHANTDESAVGTCGRMLDAHTHTPRRTPKTKTKRRDTNVETQ